MFYCGRHHQVADWKDHKDECNAVKKAQKAVATEEHRLRRMHAASGSLTDFYEEIAGRFGIARETQPYFKARSALVESLLHIQTYAGVKALHDQIIDTLRLTRLRAKAIQKLIPALKLRLGEDQGCYDFCLWWMKTGRSDDYVWEDLNLPFLDIKNANVFEPLPEFVVDRDCPVEYTLVMMLLKIKLLLNVRTLRNTTILGEKVSQEILDTLRSQIVAGTIVASHVDTSNVTRQTEIIRLLQRQITQLYRAVKKKNELYWPAILDVTYYGKAQPEVYGAETVEQMQDMLRHNYAAWAETPEAIDVVRELIRNRC